MLQWGEAGLIHTRAQSTSPNYSLHPANFPWRTPNIFHPSAWPRPTRGSRRWKNVWVCRPASSANQRRLLLPPARVSWRSGPPRTYKTLNQGSVRGPRDFINNGWPPQSVGKVLSRRLLVLWREMTRGPYIGPERAGLHLGRGEFLETRERDRYFVGGCRNVLPDINTFLHKTRITNKKIRIGLKWSSVKSVQNIEISSIG